MSNECNSGATEPFAGAQCSAVEREARRNTERVEGVLRKFMACTGMSYQDERLMRRLLIDAFADSEHVIATQRAALEEVLSHRSQDKDGNYVMWIGEGTFMKCEAALFPPNDEVSDRAGDGACS